MVYVRKLRVGMGILWPAPDFKDPDSPPDLGYPLLLWILILILHLSLVSSPVCPFSRLCTLSV